MTACISREPPVVYDQAGNPMRDPIPADDIPPAPILSPDEALADFEVEPGLIVELVAAEPDVVDPVAASFDGNGGMWVVEMRGYMPNADGTGEDEPVGRIVVLRDLNGNGRADTSIVFLDGLVMPRAVSVFEDGILYAAPPTLWWVDRDGYRAGGARIIDSTYAVGGNPEHQPNGLIRALDNWIYSANSAYRYRRRGGEWIRDTTEYRGQWGISQDSDGRLYYNNNSTTLVGDNFPPSVFGHNPNHFIDQSGRYAHRKIDNRVYPRRMNPGINRAYRPGELDEEGRLVNVTSAAGPAIYRGPNLGPRYQGNAFVSEPAANLVKRVLLAEDGGVVRGAMPYREREFLTSTDERFRPVNAYTAPDGTLYILDMYRGIIQHSTYLTEYLRRQIEARGLDQQLGLGRIYRVRNAATPPDAPPAMNAMDSRDLVAFLGDANGWRRDAAQRLLVDREAVDVTNALHTLVDTGATTARIHALWTLEGLGTLDLETLTAAVDADTSPRVRRHVARLTGLLPNRPAAALALLERLADSGELATRVVLALHAYLDAAIPGSADLAVRLANQWGDDPAFRDALLSGLAGREAELLPMITTPSMQAALRAATVTAETRGAIGRVALDPQTVELIEDGMRPYQQFCQPCHGADGAGIANLAPALRGSEWVLRDQETLIRIALDGVTGPIDVAGRRWAPAGGAGLMPGLRGTRGVSDAVLAAALTYARNVWGNTAPPISAEAVRTLRETTANRQGAPYTADELNRLRN